jgi:hypothetical protein
VVGQVFEEGIVGGDHPGVDGAAGQGLLVTPVVVEIVRPRRRQHRPGIAQVPAVTEGRGDAPTTLQLHDQD